MEGCFISGATAFLDDDNDWDAENVVLRCGKTQRSSHVLLAEHLRCLDIDDDKEVMLVLRMLAMKDTCDNGAAPGHE